MKLRMTLVGALACLAFGCATSTELEDKARMHGLRADQAAARGDYTLAATEKDEADRLHAKAVKRAYKHGETANVEVPANLPPPPTGY